MTAILGLLRYVLIPAAALASSGVAGAFRQPGARLRSAIQHLTAGIVFAAVGMELLPDILHEARPGAMAGGFICGVALMLGLKAYTAKVEKQHDSKRGKSSSLLWTLAVDVFIDGLLVGVGFAAGAKEGILLTVALTGEVLFLGLSSAASLSRGGASRARIVSTTFGLSAVMVAGGVAGSAALQGLSGGLLEAVLSFGCAALLYLVTEELLVEAHEEPETPALTAMFFLGFLLLALLEMAIRRPGA